MKTGNKITSIGELRLRSGRASDAVAIDRLVRTSLGAALSHDGLTEQQRAENLLTLSMGVQAFLNALRSPRERTWVVIPRTPVEHDVAGYLVACAAQGRLCATFNWMAVATPYQGTGVADRLMRAGLAWAHGDVELSVVHYNIRAIKFYERHGFATVGESEGFQVRRIRMRRIADPNHPVSA